MKRVAILGANGLVGDSLARNMSGISLKVTRDICDLNEPNQLSKLLEDNKIDTVINCAAVVGGIMMNRNNQYDMYSKNIGLTNNIIYECIKANIDDLVLFGSNCAYPSQAKKPYQELDFATGKPEQTNYGYGAAKISSMMAGQAAEIQYGIRIYHPIPCSLYGLNDNYRINESHFIPSLIRKVSEAIDRNENKITFWGTGKPRRELMYADDLSDAIECMIKNKLSFEPINIGTSKEYSINYVVDFLCKYAGFKGEIVWDKSKPDGAISKALNSTKIRSYGWEPRENFESSLRKTYDYYVLNGSNRK